MKKIEVDIMFGIELYMESIKGTGLVELRQIPADENTIKSIVKGMSRPEVKRWLHPSNACFSMTPGKERKWLEAVEESKDVVWGIWFQGELVGNCGLHKKSEYSYESGTVIWNPEVWASGVASTMNHMRMWFAFYYLNLLSITSTVYVPNIGSRKALESVGYYTSGESFPYFFRGGNIVEVNQFSLRSPLVSWDQSNWSDKQKIAFEKAQKTYVFTHQKMIESGIALP